MRTKSPPRRPKKKASQTIDANAIILECDIDAEAWPKFEKLSKSTAKLGPTPHKSREK